MNKFIIDKDTYINYEIKNVVTYYQGEYDNDAVVFTVKAKGKEADFIEWLDICSDGHLLYTKESESHILKCQLNNLCFLFEVKADAAKEILHEIYEELDEKLNSNAA